MQLQQSIAASVGNNNNVNIGGGVKPSKRQKIGHQFSAKGGGHRNQNVGNGQTVTGQGLQQQQSSYNHAIVPDQLKLYSEYNINIIFEMFNGNAVCFFINSLLGSIYN